MIYSKGPIKYSTGRTLLFRFENVLRLLLIGALILSVSNLALAYSITPTAGPGGSIDPATVQAGPDGSGGSVHFNISADGSYIIEDVIVDGSSLGGISSYSFVDPSGPHTISCTFTPIAYQIDASAGAGGSINPAGIISPVTVASADQVFDITAQPGYAITDVTVNGAPVGGVAGLTSYTYTFTTGSITANQTIAATFDTIDFQIDASAGAGGSINPAGIISPVTVASADQVFDITAQPGYAITDVTVNGAPVGGVAGLTSTTYTFSTGSITANQTIVATFDTIDFQIDASAGAGGSINPVGIVSPVTVASADQDFNITAQPGYAITDVTVNGAPVGGVGGLTSTTYTFTTGSITANQTIAATFDTIDFQIDATAGAGGSINPVGVVSPVTVASADQVFNITTQPGYAITDVTVNGAPVGGVAGLTSYTYTFTTGSITANQTIAATFDTIDFQIDATAGAGGSINPVGIVSPVTVTSADQIFDITAQPGYAITDVTVNGAPVGGVAGLTSYTYTFTTGSITANQTIAATFDTIDYQIDASAGAGGSISPAGTISPVTVASADQVFNITAQPGYAITDVLVNGASVGDAAGLTTYTYTYITGSISANQTIAATFDTIDFQIDASAGAGGSINPVGIISPVTVESADQVYNIATQPGYAITDVIVNGASVGDAAGLLSYSYTFTSGSIIVDQTIAASFNTIDYQIDATAGAGGSINPAGIVSPVTVESADQVFNVNVQPGYVISDVLVNAVSVGDAAGQITYSYTFTSGSITADQTIAATFNTIDYQIDASAAAGGSISPAGVITPVTVESANQVFDITAQPGYAITDVMINGASVGDAAGLSTYTYTFITGSVSANQTIAATFYTIDYQIDASAGTGGNISPAGIVSPVTVESADQVFNVTTQPGYVIADVIVNGASVGDAAGLTTYDFTFTTGSITADQTIATTFNTVDYQIDASAGINGSINPTGIVSPVTVESADQVFDITAQPGFAITDVLVNGASVGDAAGLSAYAYTFITGSISADQTITATFYRIDYQIDATAGAGGSISPVGVVVPVTVESVDQVFNVTTLPGYAIADVTVNGASVGDAAGLSTYMYTFITGSITADQTIAASFIPIDYLIDAAAGTGGSINPAGFISPVTVESTDQVFNVTTQPGYVIADVTVNGASVGDAASLTSYAYTFVSGSITADQTIVATFSTVDYQIDASAGAGGSISPAGTIAPVTVISADQMFNITADTGFVIDDVLINGVTVGDAGGLPAYTYSFISGAISADQTIAATFRHIEYMLNTSISGGFGTGSIQLLPDQATYHYGDSVQLTAVPGVGEIFSSWSGGLPVAGGNPGTITIAADPAQNNVSADFSKITFAVVAGVATGGGTITPDGNHTIDYGDASPACTITPDPCYHIADVVVDGVSVGAVSSYPAFINVTADHTIEAHFEIDTFQISVTTGTGGTITPPDPVSVNCGSDQVFAITPDAANGYHHVANLIVDGTSLGEGIETHSFNNVTQNHTISALFADHGTSCAGATAVGLNSVQDGAIDDNGNEDFYRIDVPEPGGVLTLYTTYTGDRTDTYGHLLDDGCNEIAHNDDGGYRRNFRIIQTVAAGSYYLRVRNYYPDRTGTYQLHVEYESDDHGSDCAAATPIVCDSITAGRIYPARNRDYFRLQLDQPGLIAIQSTGSTDTYGSLLDSACNELISNDDNGSGRNFFIEQMLDPGIYYIGVRHYNSRRTGNYSLDVQCTLSYTITASAEYGGAITPDGSIIVSEGANQTFTILPNFENTIADVQVDGSSVGAVDTYTFNNVNADHIITATFNVPPEKCVELSDIPLDIRRHGAAPNIMFVQDDSGSMDWEFMTTDEDGKFTVGNQEYEYLFDMDDKLFKTGTHSHVLSGADRMVWASQWSEINKVYYNPEVDYEPWPSLPNADPENPRSFPTEDTPTIDLSATFYTFDAGFSETIIDNQDVRFSLSSPQVIVDDTDGGFSKSAPIGTWSHSTSPETYGSHAFESGEAGEYIATWTPDLSVDGQYMVYARWEATAVRSSAVPYTIYHATGSDTVTVDQQTNGGQWVVLGTYAFNQGVSGYVGLDTVVTDNSADSVSADAVKFVLSDGWDWATSSEAYNDNYYWTSKDGTYTAAWRPNVGQGQYHVYASWVDNATRSHFVPYTIDFAFGSTVSMVNQSQDDGGWYWLGIYDFDAGDGKIELNYTRSGIFDTVSADAIRLLPTAATTVDIKNAHYYAWSDQQSRPYLVVVDGGALRYWAVDDGNNNGLIEAGELAETTAPPDDIRSTRTYSEERQNFANWFQYYRKRDLVTRYAIGKVIVSMQGVRIGMRGINGVLVQPVLNVKVGGEDYTTLLLDGLYNYRLDGHRSATPLRQGLEEVGRYFDQDDDDDGGIGPSPIATEDEGGACQQNFAVVFTDGFYNGLPPHVGNADGDNGIPFADTGINTLADVAMHYYENDLADNVEDRVPINPADDAIHQHMVSYGVTFGVYGTMNPDDYDLENCTGLDCPQWPVPITAGNDKRLKIDDLWHASVNGHGTFMSASDPEALVQAFLMVMQNIESRIGSAASVSVNGDELYGKLDEGVRMYQSSYTSDGWTGDVKAYEVDADTGHVDTTSWVFSAAAMLESRTWDDRIIATYDGESNGIPFRFDDLTEDQKNHLVDTAEVDYTQARSRLQYLRGERSLEEQHGGPFRTRYKVLGDIVHSSPVFEAGALYVGGNDGMLHAFDATNGSELFAFAPNLVFRNLKDLSKPTYAHRYYVDQTPVIKRGVDLGGGNKITLLTGGLGKGGQGYYALDITDHEMITSETQLVNRVMWEYPRTGPAAVITAATDASPIVVTAAGHGFATGDTVTITGVEGNTAANGTWTVTADGADPDNKFSLNGSGGNGAYSCCGVARYKDPDMDDLGYSYSKPAIVPSNDADRWIMLFGNGYNSMNSHAVLFIIDPVTGTLLKKLDTGAGNCNGLSSPVAVDVNHDGLVDYAFAGDLKGNLWKFDLTGDMSNWGVAYSDGSDLKPLFQAKDGLNPQPITTKPDVMQHCGKDGMMVIFGTGKYLGDYDYQHNKVQTVYGIWDYSENEDAGEYLGSFERGSTPMLSNQPNTVKMLQQTELPGDYFALDGKPLRVLTNNPATDSDPPDEEWLTTSLDSTGLTCSYTDGEGTVACDPNSVGTTPDPTEYAGWYFDLPATGERVASDLMIRDSKVIYIGFVPEQSPCGTGGNSWVMEQDACSGGRLSKAQFDINGDGVVDSNDLLVLTDADGNPIDENGNLLNPDDDPILVAPTGMMYPGRLLPPAILRTGNEEIKYFSTNVGNIVTMRERGVPMGVIYWMELMQ